MKLYYSAQEMSTSNYIVIFSFVSLLFGTGCYSSQPNIQKSNSGECLKFSTIHPHTYIGFILIASIPKYKLEKLTVFKDYSLIWEIIPKNERYPIYSTKFGKIPKGYIQVFPENNQNPVCLQPDVEYEIIYSYLTKKKKELIITREKIIFNQ